MKQSGAKLIPEMYVCTIERMSDVINKRKYNTWFNLCSTKIRHDRSSKERLFCTMLIMLIEQTWRTLDRGQECYTRSYCFAKQSKAFREVAASYRYAYTMQVKRKRMRWLLQFFMKCRWSQFHVEQIRHASTKITFPLHVFLASINIT